jgi:hypothetical protein
MASPLDFQCTGLQAAAGKALLVLRMLASQRPAPVLHIIVIVQTINLSLVGWFVDQSPLSCGYMVRQRVCKHA